jgi:hypothetical protein
MTVGRRKCHQAKSAYTSNAMAIRSAASDRAVPGAMGE